MHGKKTIEAAQRDRCGYLTTEELARIAEDDSTRLVRVLVKWHEGRFVAPAQDAGAFIKALEGAGFNLRDVSLAT